MQSKWLPATMPGDVFEGNAGVGLGTDLCGAKNRRSRRQCRQKTEPPCTRSVRTSGVGGQPRLTTSRGHLPDLREKPDRKQIQTISNERGEGESIKRPLKRPSPSHMNWKRIAAWFLSACLLLSGDSLLPWTRAKAEDTVVVDLRCQGQVCPLGGRLSEKSGSPES